MIIGHIAGLTQNLKSQFKDIFTESKYTIVDLDDFTDTIMEDSTMSKLIQRYEYHMEKTKNGNSSKILIRQHMVKSREINLKINAYWKKQMEFYINEIGNDDTGKTIILIGHINFFRNIRIFLNIDITAKIFVNISSEDYSKETIETNLDLYRSDIINGVFNLDLINGTFLCKRREIVTSLYQKNGYQLKTFDICVSFFDNNLKNDDLPAVLYYASEHLYKRKIPLKPITAYTDEWVAIVSAIGSKEVIKGYIDNDLASPFIQEQSENALSKFVKKIYVYAIINTIMFVPVYTKNYIYKYKSSNIVQIGRTIEINNAKNKLSELGIKFIKYNEMA